jgi:hypothetical protein
MGKRTAPNTIHDVADLGELSTLVVDKRSVKRSGSRRGRRNRHYANQLVRNVVGALKLQAKSVSDADPREALELVEARE